jgi:hypothetical protein
VHRQHRRHLELVGAVLDKVVQPVVVGAADRIGELRVHVVAREKRQAGGREQHGDVDALHLHADDLRFGVVAALDREHDVLVAAGADQRPANAIVLRDVAVVAGRRAVEKPQGPPAHAGAAAVDRLHRRGDPRFERRVEVFVEQVGRLHDVHVAIDEAVAFFHCPFLPRRR